jgi:hypothetical protein
MSTVVLRMHLFQMSVEQSHSCEFTLVPGEEADSTFVFARYFVTGTHMILNLYQYVTRIIVTG